MKSLFEPKALVPPMFLISKPSDEMIRRFISAQRAQPFSYPAASVDYTDVPSGYTVDHNRIELGKGEAVYRRVVEAVRRWEMFNIGWLQLCWPDAPIEKGTTVAVLARHYGCWSLSACRIVGVIDQEGPMRKYGFAYGTLPDHAERGQESFIVEWQSEDDSVWYDIFAYSRPNQLLPKLAYPVTRLLQKRFARDSMDAMLRSSTRC